MTQDVEAAISSQEQRSSLTQSVFTDAELEKLGRERPATLKTVWAEIGFVFSLLGSMLVAEYFISGFNMLIPTLSNNLDFPAGGEIWPASVFSLVTGALLLPIGRLADMYGGYRVFTIGLVWFFVWTLVAGFSKNYIMLVICRALQGFGPAAFLPSGIMLVGGIYRPGPRKNIIFSLYGAFAPLGFFAGVLFSGLSDHYFAWNWYFWIGAIILFLVIIAAFLAVPSGQLAKRSLDVQMDWWGAFTIVPGLLLLVFSITYSAHAPQGWRSPYIPTTFVLGILLLGAAVYVEGWVASAPLLPFDMFKVKGMKALTVSLFMLWGVFGIYLFYATQYITSIMGKSTLQTCIWFIPMAAGGLVLATSGGFILHLFPGSVLLAISGVGFVMCTLLFAIIPDNANFWAYIFPAMICATLGVDVTYTVTNVFITTSMPKHRQGLAGAFINSLVFLGISFFLGIADLAVANTAHLGKRMSYKVAFWLGVGLSVAAFLLFILFVKVGRAKSELTVDEKAELEAALREPRPSD